MDVTPSKIESHAKAYSIRANKSPPADHDAESLFVLDVKFVRFSKIETDTGVDTWSDTVTIDNESAAEAIVHTTTLTVSAPKEESRGDGDIGFKLRGGHVRYFVFLKSHWGNGYGIGSARANGRWPDVDGERSPTNLGGNKVDERRSQHHRQTFADLDPRYATQDHRRETPMAIDIVCLRPVAKRMPAAPAGKTWASQSTLK